MRSLVFNVAYYVVSTLYVLSATLAAALPGRRPVNAVVRLYAQRMLWWMRVAAGIQVDLRGCELLPEGPFIIAAKHQSWGDGFVMYANVENLTFVTGDHLERFPLIGGVLKKLGAIVVDNCGGPEARAALTASSEAAHREGKRILIYPEGALAKVGERFRYRSGVWHMYKDFNLPVVPVATNLGLFWPQQDWAKRPGKATVEFLKPIMPGLDKATFLMELELAVETRSAELAAMATGRPARPSVLVRPAAKKAAIAAAGAS